MVKTVLTLLRKLFGTAWGSLGAETPDNERSARKTVAVATLHSGSGNELPRAGHDLLCCVVVMQLIRRSGNCVHNIAAQ